MHLNIYVYTKWINEKFAMLNFHISCWFKQVDNKIEGETLIYGT